MTRPPLFRASLLPPGELVVDNFAGGVAHAGASDVSPGAVAGGRRCSWCRELLPATVRPDARFCGKKCRQTAFRLRRRRTTEAATDRPMRLAYADPPYPGRAARYYKDQATFAGEVDHRELIASLQAFPDGWALSTAADALRDVLPLCPPEARVCAWVKPVGACPLTYGLHNTWEPLIVVRGRQRRPGVRDWLSAQPARFGGDLPGRKPLLFCAWLFDCLGLMPGDELVDLFPGTGVIGRAWDELGDVAPVPERRVGEVLRRHVAEDLGDAFAVGGA